jgi:diguanylate cyclase (GGDEF)-like protein
MPKAAILVVDDDPFFNTFCSEILRGEGYTVHAAKSGVEALELLITTPVSLVVADIYMPEMTGLELLESIKARHPSTDVVIMTGYASIETAIQALKSGAADYLRKPFAAEELAAVVDATLAQRRLYQENERLKLQLELYEMTRSFSSLEAPYRVLELALGTLCRVCECASGIYLHSGDDLQYMALLHQQGMANDSAATVRDALVSKGLRLLRNTDDVVPVGRARLGRILGQAADPSMRDALLVPLQPAGASIGMFVLFRDSGGRRFHPQDLDTARFLGRQIELSYMNARRVQDARQLAYIDSLTDLYNARYFDKALEEHIQEADRTEQRFSVLFLDLDSFKEVNDVHGHLTGGKTLIEVSRIIKACVRDEDTVIRYGGDEFTVLLPRTDPIGAREVAERIREAVRRHVFLGREGLDIRLTTSVGVATYPDDASSREALIEQADQAMYRNKASTRDAVYTSRSR